MVKKNCQKYFWSKDYLSKKIGVEIYGKKNSGKVIFDQKSFGQNNFWVKNVLGKKDLFSLFFLFRPKINFSGQKFF